MNSLPWFFFRKDLNVDFVIRLFIVRSMCLFNDESIITNNRFKVNRQLAFQIWSELNLRFPEEFYRTNIPLGNHLQSGQQTDPTNALFDHMIKWSMFPEQLCPMLFQQAVSLVRPAPTLAFKPIDQPLSGFHLIPIQ